MPGLLNKSQELCLLVKNCVSFSSFTCRSFTPPLKHPDTFSSHKASAETSFQQCVPDAPRHRDLCQCQQLNQVTVLPLTQGSTWFRAHREKDTPPWQTLTPSYGKKRPVRRDGFPGAMGRPRVCPDRPHRSLSPPDISICTSKVFQDKYGEGGRSTGDSTNDTLIFS